MSDPDLIVVGAGLTGLTIARLAAEAGRRVWLFERRAHLGGNSYSYADADTGLEVHKYGMHIFHTNSDKVWSFVNRFTSWVPYEHRVWAQSESGQLVPLPFSRATYSALRGRYVTWDEPLVTDRGVIEGFPIDDFGRAAVDRVGRLAYLELIRNYHEKQWGPWAGLILPSVIARLPVRQNLDTRYFNDTHQALPRYGYDHLAENIAAHHYIRPNVKLSTPVRPCDVLGWLESFPRVKVVWTGTTDVLLGLPKYDHLPWRGLEWHKWIGPAESGRGTAVINDATEKNRFTRRYDWSYLPHQRSSHGDGSQTVVTTEFPCEPKTDEQKAYPIPAEAPRRNFRVHEEMVKARFDGRVILAGRLGTYQYLNMDQAIAQGMSIWEKQLSGPQAGSSTSTSCEDPPGTTSA